MKLLIIYAILTGLVAAVPVDLDEVCRVSGAAVLVTDVSAFRGGYYPSNLVSRRRRMKKVHESISETQREVMEAPDTACQWSDKRQRARVKGAPDTACQWSEIERGGLISWF